MDSITIYHNPKCSNSRGALALLQEFGYAPKIVRYLDEPLSAKRIGELMLTYDGDPSDFVRLKESAAKEQGLSELADRKVLAAALAATPALLQRPIVVLPGRVVLARPPETLRPVLVAMGGVSTTEG